MGAHIKHRPEDHAGHPRFAGLRWSEERLRRPNGAPHGRKWEGECRACGATVRASPAGFYSNEVACECDEGVTNSRAVSAAVAEMLVQVDLLRRGGRVYGLIATHQHPDLVVLDLGERPLTIEVRAGRAGGRRFRKKPTDHCDHYAVVHRDGTIEYEPPLPAAEEEQCPSTNTDATAAAA